MKFAFGSLFLTSFLATLAHGAHFTYCTKYTTAVFGNNTADDQMDLIATLVNLAVLGDESQNVSGILAAGGGLLGFFDGSMETTNRGGMATSVNFLDGAADLPNPSPTSNTYILLSHLYQFFGALIGCTAMGFPQYMGVADMYEGKHEELSGPNNCICADFLTVVSWCRHSPQVHVSQRGPE